jgi:hypothetical protein
MDATFRGAEPPWVSGHQEVELALMKLYHVTRNDRYLKLADWFLDQRGRGYGKGMIWNNPEMGPRYCQGRGARQAATRNYRATPCGPCTSTPAPPT